MPTHRSIAVLACAFALAACGREEAKTGASSAESHAPGTTLATSAGACASYAPGTPGVVRAFCNGPATVKAFVAGKEYDLSGGTCATEGPIFTVNLGIVSTAELGGPKPDYFGLTVPAGGGHFSNAALTLTVGGKSYALTSNSGDDSSSGGTFTGAAFGDPAPVTGSFTC
jgi:hypothetical protein